MDDKDEDYKPAKGATGRGKGDPKPAKKTAKHSVDEKLIHAAQFSVNIIDLFTPVKPINFGRWNSRHLKEPEWKKLVEFMTTQGIKPFSYDNMMPLVINRRHVDPDCISNGSNGYDAKMLVLSKEAEVEKLEVLELAGGRHRKAAMAEIKKKKLEELDRLDTVRKSIIKRRVVKEEATARKQADLDACDETIAALKDEIANLGRWGVILYDQGKRFVIGQRPDHLHIQ